MDDANWTDTEIREYTGELGVQIGVEDDLPSTGRQRLVVRAWNEDGHNSTLVDLRDLIAWVKANRPELLR